MKYNFAVWEVMGIVRLIGNLVRAAVFIFLAYVLSQCLRDFTGDESNAPIIFLLAIVIISRMTDGYVYGIIASGVSAFLVNYYFMHPYAAFDLTITGYPVMVASMLITSLIISTLTTKTKKQAEQNVKLYQEQEEIKMEAEKEKIRGNLLRAISHDLRTPLTGILGASAVIAANGEDLPRSEITGLAGNIQEDAKWLISVIENLLSITKVNAAVTELKKTDEMVEEIAEEALSRIRKRYPSYKIISNVPQEIMMAPMDPLLIEQVIINLLENAVIHSGDRDGIVLSVYKNGEYVVFEVKDHGKGFPYENIDKLIDVRLSENTSRVDAIKGAGIGLSVCKSIINAHDGFFEARNNPEGGASFRFGLHRKVDMIYEQQEWEKEYFGN